MILVIFYLKGFFFFFFQKKVTLRVQVLLEALKDEVAWKPWNHPPTESLSQCRDLRMLRTIKQDPGMVSHPTRKEEEEKEDELRRKQDEMKKVKKKFFFFFTVRRSTRGRKSGGRGRS